MAHFPRLLESWVSQRLSFLVSHSWDKERGKRRSKKTIFYPPYHLQTTVCPDFYHGCNLVSQHLRNQVFPVALAKIFLEVYANMPEMRKGKHPSWSLVNHNSSPCQGFHIFAHTWGSFQSWFGGIKKKSLFDNISQTSQKDLLSKENSKLGTKQCNPSTGTSKSRSLWKIHSTDRYQP